MEIKFKLFTGKKLKGYEIHKKNLLGFMQIYHYNKNMKGGLMKKWESIAHKEKRRYIGLKDIKGNEIYEGDRVMDGSYARSTVYWCEKYARFELQYKDGTTLMVHEGMNVEIVNE